MPLIYFALESDNPVVLEKALRAVPSLCESLDYTVRLVLSLVGTCRRPQLTPMLSTRADRQTDPVPQDHDRFLAHDRPLCQGQVRPRSPALFHSLPRARADDALARARSTLICFHSMIKILDKFTLTEKLVPLLAKIKTKEPSVMIATLAVHEEMGKKCEIEASESPRAFSSAPSHRADRP